MTWRVIFARPCHAVETEDGNRGGAGDGRGGRGGGRSASSSTSRIKSTLVTPKDNWPPYRRGTGLTMECTGTDSDGAQLFRYPHLTLLTQNLP